jgi:hypothetical protein
MYGASGRATPGIRQRSFMSGPCRMGLAAAFGMMLSQPMSTTPAYAAPEVGTVTPRFLDAPGLLLRQATPSTNDDQTANPLPDDEQNPGDHEYMVNETEVRNRTRLPYFPL